MENMMAYCGIECAECPAYIATQEDDDIKRQKVADMWSKLFQAPIKKEEINCDGCHTQEGRLFSHCLNCQVRLCGMEKSVDTCGHCADYSCSKIDDLLSMLPLPSARKNLDKIKQTAG